MISIIYPVTANISDYLVAIISTQVLFISSYFNGAIITRRCEMSGPIPLNLLLFACFGFWLQMDSLILRF